MNEQINSFVMCWHPVIKRGSIRLFVGPNNRTVDVPPITSAEEFAAMAAILNESPIYLLSDGRICTQTEPAGGS